MRAGGVVVREVPAQQTAEVPFVDHDDVIEAFPTNRADDALGEGILPGRPRRDKDLAYPQAFHPPYEHVPVDGIPITEQVLVGTTKKSTATISPICAPRKVRHVEDGRGEGCPMYFATVSSATS